MLVKDRRPLQAHFILRNTPRCLDVYKRQRGYTTTINHDDITNLSKVLGKSIEVIIGTDYVPPDTSPKQPKDLVKFLNQAEVMFDGDTYKLNDDDRKKIRAALELAFWDAKERNKRKKQ